MRLLVLLITVFLTGCTVKGNAIYSQGLITGWEHNGFKNHNDGVEILFSVENREYKQLDETLVGVTIKDRKKDMVTAIGKTPFIIKVELRTPKSYVYLKQNARLSLAGKEYHPIKVKKGIDRVLSGRKSHDINRTDYDEFMAVDNTLEGIDHNWLWFEFDVETPHPSQSFSMYLELRDSGNVEVIEANFNAKQMNIYHH